jgi:hypothetical protein
VKKGETRCLYWNGKIIQTEGKNAHSYCKDLKNSQTPVDQAPKIPAKNIIVNLVFFL